MFRRHIAGLESPWFDRRRFKSVFDPPKPPPPPPPPPEPDDPAVEESRRGERKDRRRRRGLRGTILTSGLGDTSQVPDRRSSLLGE
ncbi:MAG: hypothetical protein QNJ06_12905 [Kiloniellales bacterium]|nr:hypothetical protein [Kiloniellales bacterium]